ncbi:MAG: DHH family phosphoesterase [Peptostreptococcaceae bacterium]|nr:DHH family phosphoesterase [Peptostreptococcaceae bacterium]
MKEKGNSLVFSNIFMVAASIGLMFYNIFIGLAALAISGLIIKVQSDEEKKQQQEMDSYLETFTMTMDYRTKQSISNLHMPLCMVNGKGIIVWYNKKLSDVFGKKGLFGEKIEDYVSEFDIAKMMETEEGSIEIDQFYDRVYRAIYSINSGKDEKEKNLMICFEDITEVIHLRKEYEQSQTAIISIQVDSLDEVLDSTEEQNRPRVTAEIEKLLKTWAEKYNMMLKKTSADKYFGVTTEEDLLLMEENKFQILDDIRAIDFANTIPVSISMGVSPYVGGLKETQLISESALDIALGRGGDQVAVKRNDKYSFYGGMSKAVEKKTRVKARIVSYALKDLILESSDVLVMGHNYADLDAIGSAMGVVAIAEMLERDVKVVLEHSNSSIDVLYNRIKENQKYGDIFVSKSEAKAMLKSTTLLVVVDTHRPSLTECPELVDMSDRVVVIDHHRRGQEFVENPVLIFHETYASSASEMVTELIQYTKERPHVNPLIAEALLSGITLDTKNFTFKTGVRTFEAAAFLRKQGADTVAVKTLFQGDMETFRVRADAMNRLKVIGDSVALTYCEKQMENPQLVASKIADELLNLKGIQASFVLAQDFNEEIQVSARSLGKINVQVIMEKLNGGGHMETAATQINDISMNDAIEKVEEQIMIYLKEIERK